MKKIILPFVLLTLLFSANAQMVEKIWETDTVFHIPESVLCDDTVVYVSNVHGSPLDKDGKGYISRMDVNGNVLEREWVKGIDAPKGMGVDGPYLYVTNITEIVVINRRTGAIVNRLAAPNSVFMNDICTTDNGMHFASDLSTNSIYWFTKDTCGLYIKDELLERVNGLYYGGQRLLYAGTNGTVYQINMVDKALKKYIQNTGPIDGLERISTTKFVISDWSGKVQLISTNGQHVELLNFSDKNYNAADLDYSNKHKLIFIPTFFGNTVAAFQLIE